jgi:perosamine synthetase
MIDLDSANIGYVENASIADCLLDGTVSTRGYMTAEFERLIAKYLGEQTQHILAVNSGSNALYLALKCCNLKPNSLVAIPALTFVATANAVVLSENTPFFVDVNLDTWCIDFQEPLPSAVEAIIGVDLYGKVCEWEEYNGDAKKISDSCESFGVRSPISEFLDFICYSFNGNKIITTGGGGLLIGEESSIKCARILASQGVFENEVVMTGNNLRMPALNASLGIGQLSRIEELLTRKRRINEIYRNELSNVCEFQEGNINTPHSFWFTAGRFEREAKDLAIRLENKGIPSRRVFKPLPLEPAYKCEGFFPNAEYIYQYGLCLPSGTFNSDNDIALVCKTIKSIL